MARAIMVDSLGEASEAAAVFHGWKELGIVGIIDASPHDPIALGDDRNRYAQQVATAVATLRRGGIGGPYGLALSPSSYTTVIETSEHGGYPLLDQLHRILEDPSRGRPVFARAW